jgi:hypothetical protein
MLRTIWSWAVVGTLVLFILGVGVAFMTSNHPWIADVFFLAGSILFLARFLTWEEAKSHDKVTRAFIVQSTTIVTVLICIGSIAGNHYLNRAAVIPPIPLISTEITMECNPIGLPIRIPPGETAHIKAFNKKTYSDTKDSIFDIHNDGANDLLWPDQKLINSAKHTASIVGYKCDAANHAKANLVNVVIQMSTNFNDGNHLIHRVIIDPLDAGTTFSFYLINECPVIVSLISPNTATVQVVGEDKRRTVPLFWPHRSLTEQVMIFFPSKVAWTGNACE